MTGQSLWYASRATGVVALVLLTAVVVLGILVRRNGRLPGLPRFVVTGLHRNLSLLAVAFLGVHIGTAIVDSYVSINPLAAIIPFTSSYEPLWVGLGTVSVDLAVAVVVTSLLRSRIGLRAWRAVHWLAYACYPVAVAHSLGASPDLHSGGLRLLTFGCLATTAAAVWVRVALPTPPRGRRTPAPMARRSRPQQSGAGSTRPAQRSEESSDWTVPGELEPTRG